MWNTGERTEVHDEVKRKHGFEEQGFHMRISLCVVNIEGLIYESSEWIFHPLIGYSGRVGGGFFY